MAWDRSISKCARAANLASAMRTAERFYSRLLLISARSSKRRRGDPKTNDRSKGQMAAEHAQHWTRRTSSHRQSYTRRPSDKQKHQSKRKKGY